MQPNEPLNSTLQPPPSGDTNAWRILHDAGTGLWVDHFDGRWLVQTRSERFPDSLRDLAGEEVSAIYWRPRDKSASTAPELVAGEVQREPFLVREHGVFYRIDFAAGYSSGIFLDQRQNRQRVREWARPGQRVLNTFAYTGGFSVVAALGGATTTTLDLSQPYLDWTRHNFAANGLDAGEHHFVKGDALEWMATFARQGRSFHGVVLDPPTFSRNRKKTFRTDADYAELAGIAAAVVEPGGWILCCANTHRLEVERFERDVIEGVAARGRSVDSVERFPMPPEFRGDDYLKSLRVVVG